MGSYNALYESLIEEYAETERTLQAVNDAIHVVKDYIQMNYLLKRKNALENKLAELGNRIDLIDNNESENL